MLSYGHSSLFWPEITLVPQSFFDPPLIIYSTYLGKVGTVIILAVTLQKVKYFDYKTGD